MRKKIIAAALAVASTVSLAACSDSADSNNASGGKLIVYTNSNSNGRAEWLTEKAQENGFDIEVVGQGGNDTTNKLIAEAGNPVADVVFGLNNMYFEQLEAEDILIDYTPEWSGEVDENLGDNDGSKSYWPIVQQGIVLAYNKAAFGANDAPKDWTELGTNPKYNGRYQTETGLGGATTTLVVAGMLSRFRDDAGDLGVSDEGWKQIEDFFANGSPAVEGKDLFARMSDDEVDMGQMWTSGLPAFEEEYGIDADVARPSVGVPYAVEQVALVKGTKNQEQAEKFINWFGSGEVQAEWSKEFGSMPANEKAIAQADPEIVEFHESLQQQDIDWDFVREHNSDWMEKIELQYLK